MKELVVYGAGAVGRLTSQIVEDINRRDETWLLRGFLDDGAPGDRRPDGKRPVLGGRSWLEGRAGVSVAVAIGAPAARQEVVQALRRLGHEDFATLVHPRAWVGARTVLGAGCLIYPGSMIDPDVEIGTRAIINKLCSIGHDTVVGDFVTLGPAVHVTARGVIGTGCSLGAGCCTLNGVSIGPWALVGAGSVVTRTIPADVTAVGAPARVVRQRQPRGRER